MMRSPALATLLCAAALAALAPPSATAVPRAEKARLEAFADRTGYRPGETARLAARVTIEPGWHVNSNPASFEWLIPTQVGFDPPPGWPAAEVSYPLGEIQTFAFSEQPLSVYDGEVTVLGRLAVPADAPAGGAPVGVRLTYQACNDTQCLPPVDAAATVELAVGAGGEPAHGEVFAAAAGAAAAPGRGRGSAAPNLALVLLLGVVGGLILNVMPCVLPVLSLKLFGMVESAQGGRRRVVVGSLATSAGILTSFWALALAAVAAKAAGSAVGWGVQFQNPVFVTLLAVVVLLFSLNLWGLFEVRLPAALARAGGSRPRHGIGGHFASGLFATLMATPCSAPFLGTAVGFALAQEAAIVFAVFTAVGAGMALPYLALAAAPGAARWLPRPGAWMETLKGVLGFLLAGAAVWLLYVLSAQIDPVRLALVELGLLSMALFVWLRRRAGRGGARLAVAAAVVVAIATAAIPYGAAPAAAREESTGLIAWVPFDRTAAEALADEGRVVFVDVTADWCFTCKFNEKLVLETPEVAAAFDRHAVVAMRADWTNRDDEIGDYLASFGRYGIPFYALYRPGAEPQVFSELLTKSMLLSALADAGDAPRVARAKP